MVQETIRAKDSLTVHEEVTERAITLLTNCELDVIDIRKRVGHSISVGKAWVLSLELRKKPNRLLESRRLKVGCIQDRRNREGVFRHRRFMRATFPDMIKVTIGAESLVTTRKRTLNITLALIAPEKFLRGLRHSMPSLLNIEAGALDERIDWPTQTGGTSDEFLDSPPLARGTLH
jgi:hypothetical protein